MQSKLDLELTLNTAVLVVSDIHLRLPITRELGVIQSSLVERITELGKNSRATLILNGDVFELWEQTDQTVADIINGYIDLTKAISNFSKKRGHKVIEVVGNHDEQLANSAADRAIVANRWGAEVVMEAKLSFGNKAILIQHGHQYDPYNMSSDLNVSRGKKLVQNTLPLLQKNLPLLFENIGDVTDRGLLPEFVIGNFMYKLFAPIIVPMVLLILICLALVNKTPGIFWLGLAIIVCLAVSIIIIGLLTRLIASMVLGGGNIYVKKVDTNANQIKAKVIILGHTHYGGIFKRQNYIYANSGCNDIIAVKRTGWLVLPKFDRYLQMSGIIINYSKKPPIQYHCQTIPLVE